MKVSFGTMTITDKAKKLIAEALDKNRVTSGKLVREFEKEFASFVGTKEAIAVSSGTDAIAIALAALKDYGILAGREIIVPALTFIATANAVTHAGFEPTFVDIKKETLNLDENQLEGKMSRAVGGIVPVHLMGKPANLFKIREVASKWNIPIIEDCAEAHGATYYGKKVGTFGMAGCFSLYAAHIISSIEGGIITTNDNSFAEICRSLRNHGRSCTCPTCVLNTSPEKCPKRFAQGHDQRFVHDRIGFSSKMNELEAAVGLGSIEIANWIVEKRRENFYQLQKGLTKFEEVYTINEDANEKIGPHAFPIIFRMGGEKNRDKFGEYLTSKEIDSRTLFQSIPTQARAYARYGYKTGEFPNAEYVASNGLHVGVHQDMGKEECDYILETIEKFLMKK